MSEDDTSEGIWASTCVHCYEPIRWTLAQGWASISPLDALGLYRSTYCPATSSYDEGHHPRPIGGDAA